MDEIQKQIEESLANLESENDHVKANAFLRTELHRIEWLRHQQSIISQQSKRVSGLEAKVMVLEQDNEMLEETVFQQAAEIAKLKVYLMQTAEEWPCTCGNCDGEHFGYARKE